MNADAEEMITSTNNKISDNSNWLIFGAYIAYNKDILIKKSFSKNITSLKF